MTPHYTTGSLALTSAEDGITDVLSNEEVSSRFCLRDELEPIEAHLFKSRPGFLPLGPIWIACLFQIIFELDFLRDAVDASANARKACGDLVQKAFLHRAVQLEPLGSESLHSYNVRARSRRRILVEVKTI